MSNENRKIMGGGRAAMLALAGFAVLGLAAWFLVRMWNAPEQDAEAVVAARMEKLADYRKQAEELATTYGWVDKEKGVVRIPVDQAVALTIERLKAKPVGRSGVPVQKYVPASVPQEGGTP